MFTDPELAGSLTLRGGTALNKLLIHPPFRYSEDIDLVQPEPGAIFVRISYEYVSEVPELSNSSAPEQRAPALCRTQKRRMSFLPGTGPLSVGCPFNTRPGTRARAPRTP